MAWGQSKARAGWWRTLWVVERCCGGFCSLFEISTEIGKHRKFQSRKLTDSGLQKRKLTQASAVENGLVVWPLFTVKNAFYFRACPEDMCPWNSLTLCPLIFFYSIVFHFYKDPSLDPLNVSCNPEFVKHSIRCPFKITSKYDTMFWTGSKKITHHSPNKQQGPRAGHFRPRMSTVAAKSGGESSGTGSWEWLRYRPLRVVWPEASGGVQTCASISFLKWTGNSCLS